MDDQRFGSIIRAVRMKRSWRQIDLAKRSGLAASTISRLERGHLDRLSLNAVRRVASALDVRVELVGRWRGGDLDRLVNARHSALHEAVARWFRDELPAWTIEPEVSYSFYGERGVIDLLAWHATSGAVLVIELKTQIVDVNELVGRVDQKRRLALEVSRERGRATQSSSTSSWVIVASSRTNRARLAAHGAMLRTAFPMDGRGIGAWLRSPAGPIAALSMWHQGSNPRQMASARRARPGPPLSPI